MSALSDFSISSNFINVNDLSGNIFGLQRISEKLNFSE